MNDIAGQLHDALEQQGIPIEGVSIGRRHDRSTWRVDFAPTATDAQRSAAAALLRTFNLEQEIEKDVEVRNGVVNHTNSFISQVNAREAAIELRRSEVLADLALLPTANAAQQRQILARILNAEVNDLTSEKQTLDWLVRIVKIVRKLL